MSAQSSAHVARGGDMVACSEENGARLQPLGAEGTAVSDVADAVGPDEGEPPPVEQAAPRLDTDALFRSHRGSLHRFFLRRTRGDWERAEDLVQDVFVAAVAGGEQPVREEAWLYAIANRRLVDDLRRGRRRPGTVALTDRLAEAIAAPDHDTRLGGVLAEVVSSLPAVQQRVFVWKVLEGLPFVEIARRIGFSEGAARMQLVRALKAMRTELESRGFTP